MLIVSVTKTKRFRQVPNDPIIIPPQEGVISSRSVTPMSYLNLDRRDIDRGRHNYLPQMGISQHILIDQSEAFFEQAAR